MKVNEKFNFDETNSPNKIQSANSYPHNSVNTYTVLCILRKMKDQMGLEAMLEYLEKYLMTIESHNPQLKMAVIQALSRLNVANIYKEACLCQGRGGKEL